ncbi:glycerol-3-phosphate ABC transporter permease [Pullulanibacillus camelliae]|uniref:Glycerol-3-phosphate ABC transporter permease n=1 Tax=Pullulanibacillus camelliae TaxID=1707096 RepID=A0A8J2VLF5_9BACL|nr:sugar ABC transporter permease [Pullulanibacillus camelliae]GGE29922.1 glycerol-3-phosphate ABC transporter permease [Pullulanibacillus camelliae]
MMLEPSSVAEVTEANPTAQVKRKRRVYRDLVTGWTFLLPSIVLLAVFVFYPMLRTIYLSFFLTDFAGNPTVFVGLNNFKDLMTSSDYLFSLVYTLIFVAGTVIATLLLSLFLALLANEKLKGIGVFRTLFASTMGISVSVASVFWMFLFNPSIGMMNRMLQALDLPTVSWLTNPHWALFSISLSTVWMNIGFSFLILLGGLQNVSSSLYESAQINGVPYFSQLRKITLPLLSPTLFFVIIVSVINAFQTFGQIDMLTKGGPSNHTNLLVYSIYQDAFINHQYGPASAESVVLAIIIFGLTILQFKLGEKKVHYQ